MDNKDFDEVEDIFGTDIEENYDVPVFNSDEQNKSEVNNFNIASEEAPVFENNIEDETPVYEDTTTEDIPSDNEPTFENTVSDVFDVHPTEVVDNSVDESVNVEQNYGPVPVEPSYDEEVNEHPDAVISLNNKEEEKEETKIEDVPAVKITDNSSLKFVIIVGIIILIAIFLLPLVDKLGI